MNRLPSKIVAVIGGVGGIGGAIAERFQDEGATVYATSRTTAETQEATGDGIRALRADAIRLADLSRVFETIRAESGRIDILVVNAGLSEFAPLGEITEDHFDETFGLNVRALVFAAQGAVELMRPGGAIVLVGSIAGAIGTKGYGTYGATKAAVRSFARTWANELAPRGIRVNVVSPGPTDTAMFASASDEVRSALTQLIPLGRMGRRRGRGSGTLSRQRRGELRHRCRTAGRRRHGADLMDFAAVPSHSLIPKRKLPTGLAAMNVRFLVLRRGS